VPVNFLNLSGLDVLDFKETDTEYHVKATPAAFDTFFARSDLVWADPSKNVVELAAAIRGQTGLRTPDALQAASCRRVPVSDRGSKVQAGRRAECEGAGVTQKGSLLAPPERAAQLYATSTQHPAAGGFRRLPSGAASGAAKTSGWPVAVRRVSRG
jgi:hypothetical protein